MTNTLTFTTETDHEGRPVSYLLTGDITDQYGESFPVGEFTFKLSTALNHLLYYANTFDNVTVKFQTKENQP